MTEAYPYRARAFGLRWRSQVPLHLFASVDDASAEADITVTLHTGDAPERKLGESNASVRPAPDGIRYSAGEIVTIDTYDAERIELYPGPAWEGVLPVPFFATVTALMAIRRGHLPLHGCAVELDGRAVLICGPAGAGKSTTAAGLIARGGRLISDDLSILHVDRSSGAPVVFPGRRTMRLFPAVAGFLADHTVWSDVPRMMEGKLAVFPPTSDPALPVALSDVILLGEEAGRVQEAQRIEALRAHFYRPRWMRALPGGRQRIAALAVAAQHLRVTRVMSSEVLSENIFLKCSQELLTLVHKMHEAVVD